MAEGKKINYDGNSPHQQQWLTTWLLVTALVNHSGNLSWVAWVNR
jgi:hypothetical protein